MPANRRTMLNYATAALAALGVGFMSYLTYLHYSGSSESGCDLGEGLSCQLVNKSIYSEVLGVPVSLLGLAYFATVAVLVFQRRFPKPYRAILLFTVFSLTFSLYLSWIEWFLLGEVCVFCESSKLIMLAIGGLAVAGIAAAKERLSPGHVVAAMLAGALFTAGASAVQRQEIGAPDQTPIAQCLTERGVSMYGAYWCPSCAKEKRWFGNAYESVTYVECDPRGEGAETERCIAKDIRKTPTWIQDADGVELKRLEGAHRPEKLAEFFGCP